MTNEQTKEFEKILKEKSEYIYAGQKYNDNDLLAGGVKLLKREIKSFNEKHIHD